MLSGIYSRLLLLMGLLCWAHGLVFAEGADPLLQKLRNLELKLFDNPTEVIKEAGELLMFLNYEQQTQLWLRAWLLSLGDNATEMAVIDIDRYIAVAQEKGLVGEKVRLLLKKAEVYQPIWSKEKVKAIYEEAKEVSRAAGEAELLPRVLYEEAYYFYSLNEIPQSLVSIAEAVRLSDGWKGELEIYRYEFRSVLAVVLSTSDETAKALAIYEECIEWAKTQNFRSSSAAYAFNAAMVLVIKESPDEERILRYFDISEKQSRAIGEDQREGSSIAGKARYFFDKGRYEEARELFKKSNAIFERTNGTYLLHTGFIFLARCSEKLNQLDLAETYANKAMATMSSEYKSEKMDLYHVLYTIHSKKKNFQKALSNFEKYFDLSEKERINAEEKQFQKLRTELGLRLEEERNDKLQAKNDSLKMQNEAQARELELTNRLRIIAVVLFILFCISALTTSIAIRRGRIILASKAKIQNILDTIDEGLLTIDTQLAIKDDHSAYAQRLFPEETLSGRDIFSVLLNKAVASAEDLSLWRESLLACLGEDSIAWELNGNHLPREITLKEDPVRTLSLYWQPILVGEKIHRFLLSFRDITAVKVMEKEIVGERLQRELLQVRIMEILSRNFREARRLVMTLGERIPVLSKALFQQTDMSFVRRTLHTDKGAARTLGLQGLSRVIHAVEDALKDSTILPQEVLKVLEAEQRAYAQVFEDILHSPQDTHSERTGNLLDVTNELMMDVDQRLQKASLSLGGIEVVDQVVHWDPKVLQDIKDILIHALSNAVDHGFLLSAKKGIGPARFKIHARHHAGAVALQIFDNGAGLDWMRLESLAREKNFVPSGQQTMADVLFLEGVSTSSKVSETSGRGVGLAAVRNICQSRQGTIRITDNPEGSGTLLELTLMDQHERAS